MTKITVTKLLDQTSGESQEFDSLYNLLKYKLVITGSPLANIKAFFIEQDDLNKKFFYLKIYCSNWNNATVELKAKSPSDEDIFSSTGLDDVFNQDDIKLFNY